MEKESKIQRFKRLAQSRTVSVIKKIQVLGNCSNRSVYEYTEEDINKIFNTIERYLKETKYKFHYKKSKDNNFKL